MSNNIFKAICSSDRKGHSEMGRIGDHGTGTSQHREGQIMEPKIRDPLSTWYWRWGWDCVRAVESYVTGNERRVLHLLMQGYVELLDIAVSSGING